MARVRQLTGAGRLRRGDAAGADSEHECVRSSYSPNSNTGELA
jgi:hypothetical protein